VNHSKIKPEFGDHIQPKTAEKAVAALDTNVPALAEPQILAAARECVVDHKNG
jgi:hypothetical protein